MPKSKISPTQRSLAHLRKTCQLVQVVERWNPYARIRQDLFGIIDILAISGAETIAVQTTSESSASARVRKIVESDAIQYLRNAGWKIIVHGWKKDKAGKWQLKERDIS